MFPRETTAKTRKVPRKGNWLLLIILMMKIQMKEKKKEVLPVPRYVRTYHGSVYHSQGTGQANKIEKEQTFPQEENVHQT